MWATWMIHEIRSGYHAVIHNLSWFQGSLNVHCSLVGAFGMLAVLLRGSGFERHLQRSGPDVFHLGVCVGGHGTAVARWMWIHVICSRQLLLDIDGGYHYHYWSWLGVGWDLSYAHSDHSESVHCHVSQQRHSLSFAEVLTVAACWTRPLERAEDHRMSFGVAKIWVKTTESDHFYPILLFTNPIHYSILIFSFLLYNHQSWTIINNHDIYQYH